MTRFTEDGVRRILAAECEEAGGQKAWADRHRISPAYVCDAIQGRRALGRKLLEALGMRFVATYERSE